MKNTITETEERNHLYKRFPKLSVQDFNDLYNIYPFKEYSTVSRVKLLIYWYEVLGEKKETLLSPNIWTAVDNVGCPTFVL